MTTQPRFTIFSSDDAGNLTPIDAASLVVGVPGGETIEITWDAHPDDPCPPAIALWGGRAPKEDWSDAVAADRTAPLIVMPSAANVVLVGPIPRGRMVR